MTIDIRALAAAAAAKTNMTEAQTGGGGDYTPPEAGTARARLVAYVELGKHRDEYQGQVKIKDKVQLVFELSGAKHQPRVSEDGTKYPHRITVTESLSLNEKANFFKLFNKMRNGRDDVTHMAQLLGEPFLCKVVHKKSKDGKRTYAQLRELTGEYTVRPPTMEVENEETGEIVSKKIKVDPAISPLRIFLWDFADKAQWDSLFIEGTYDERKDEQGNVTAPAKSKNVLQEKIKEAVNFEGSPIAALLDGTEGLADALEADQDDADEDFEEEEVEAPKPTKKVAPKPAKPAATPAADDPLAGLDDDEDTIPF